MRKVFLLVTILFFLTACSKEETPKNDSFVFDGITLNYIETLDTGYDLFKNGDAEVEIKTEDGISLLHHVKDEDIYLVTIDETNITVSKNGNTVISCARDNEVCTGFEVPTFKDDLFKIANMFN